MTLDFAALLASAFLTSALSLRVPSLRPHALAAITCAALYLARVMGGPRVAVAVFATWPAVAVWLWTRAVAYPGVSPFSASASAHSSHAQPSTPHASGCLQQRCPQFPHGVSHSDGSPQCRQNGPEFHASDSSSSSPMPRRVAARVPWIAAAWIVYAAALAYGGHYLRAVWPWPLMVPNALPLLCALAGWRRPRTWAERAAYVLPASCAADLATAWAGAPGVVGAWVGVATWAAFAGCCVMAWRELRGSRART